MNDDAAAGRWFTLNRDLTVITMGPGSYEGVKETAEGRHIFDVWPDARDVFGPVYARARCKGNASAVVEYPEGSLVDVYAMCVDDDTLLVTWRAVTMFELRRTIERFADRVAQESDVALEAQSRDDQQRRAQTPPLRLVG